MNPNFSYVDNPSNAGNHFYILNICSTGKRSEENRNKDTYNLQNSETV